MSHVRPTTKTTAISDNFAAHVRRGSGLPGTDWKTPIGEPIVASQGGIVTRAGSTPLANGKNIRIHHPDGTTSYYLHLSEIWVTNGQTVAQGNVIGKSGNTGKTTGPHLHFSIANAAGQLLDPETVIVGGSQPSVTRRTIKLGSRGADVLYLQQRLGILADGIFGPGTRRAVIAYQKSRLLAADGIVGPRTWGALG
jgi:hypothetical protein